MHWNAKLGRHGDLDINPFEKPAVYTEALGPEDVVGVVRVARRAAHQVYKGLPHHCIVWRVLTGAPA